MRYRDFVVDLSPSPFGGDQFELIAGEGEGRLFEERPDSRGANFRFRVPNDALANWESAYPPPGAPRGAPPKSLGFALWDALGPARDLVSARLDRMEVGARGGPVAGEVLRIKVSTRPVLLGDLPWELLASEKWKTPLALLQGVQVARSVPVRVPVPPRLVREPTALIVVSSPRVKAGLDPGTELSVVGDALDAAGFEVHVLQSRATVETVAVQLGKITPHVLHFVGHAALNRGEGQLVFEGSEGLSDWVSAGRLASMLPPQTRLISLSTPVTAKNYQILGFIRMALAGVEIPLPTMIVNQHEINARAAAIYWRTFYKALLQENGDANRAAWLATTAVAQSGSDEWTGFALVLRDGDGRPFLFAEKPAEPFDPVRRALEIEASLRARQTNAMAEQVRRAGDRAPALLRGELETMRSKAEQVYKRLQRDR